MKNIFLFLSLALLLGACKTYNEYELNEFDKKIQSYIQKKGLKMTKSDSGLYYSIEDEGEGDFIKPNALIFTTYKGQLLNGKVFDERKEPVEMRLNQLVYGWREVAHYLKKGGKAKIIIPPSLGYGEKEMDDIPESSILVFDLEIVDTY